LETATHNHFENNEFLGNKKALYYNMKSYYDSIGENVFNYLPVTFHVKDYGDEVW
jgi:tubulin--tyrosine ligase